MTKPSVSRGANFRIMPRMARFDYPADFFNPLGKNPLRDRGDVEQALKKLVAPLEQHRSPGGARIRLGLSGAAFNQAAADLEGYARPLWGLAPAAVGGASWIDWQPIRCGLASGTNPEHPEYWGRVKDYDQRLVELAAIGLALRLVPEQLWQPLSAPEKERALAYFLAAREHKYGHSNWKLFRLMLDMGLHAIGAPADEAGNRACAADVERCYLSDGWYSDGPKGSVDHYAAFTFHILGLSLAALDREHPAYNARYRERARQSVSDITRWFADDGPALAFGRSMTYRFAAGGYFGAFAFANEEAMPWGILKGFYLRHLRWWSKLPIASSDGLLNVGYGYPNLSISESYNSPQSSYWALKAFLPLALPATHPFWRSEEAPCPARPKPAILKHAGMLVANPRGDAIALVSGPDSGRTRYGPEKYAKFAYSARYGFSIESDLRRFDQAVLDNAIGFSEGGDHFRVRQSSEIARLADEMLYGLWRPFPDVKVESFVYWHGAFHIRVHKIATPAAIMTIEGGFAIGARGLSSKNTTIKTGIAAIESPTDYSAILDLGSTVARRMRVNWAPPNTNLIEPLTAVPQLFAELPAGETVLISAIIAEGNPAAVREALTRPPAKPDIRKLEEQVASRGVDITTWLPRVAIEASMRQPMSRPHKK